MDGWPLRRLHPSTGETMKHPKVTAEDYIAARTNTAVRNRVAMAHRGLAAKIAQRYMRPGLSIEDLVQVAMIGVMRALETYQQELGAFSTYSSRWIKYYCDHYQRKTCASVSGVGRKSRVEIEHCLERGENVRLHERQLVALNHAASLDAPLERGSFEDLLPGESDTFDEAAEHGRQATLQRAIDQLPDRERYVIRRRLRGATLADVGREWGTSRERARQLEARAVAKLRFAMGAEL